MDKRSTKHGAIKEHELDIIVDAERPAQLKDKVQNALDEGRILILGSQVLIGFQFGSAFETGSDVLLAMVPLALGVAGDFFVVVRKITESVTPSLIAAAFMLVLFYGLWFGFTAYRRAHPRSLADQSQ